MRYLLDTTILIDHANGTPAARAIVDRLFAEPNDLLTCDVITAEALSAGDEDHLRAMRRLLDVLEYVATTPDAARWAGESRRSRGATSRWSIADALIGGVASTLGAMIVTRNPGDFVRHGVAVLAYDER